VSEGPPRTPYSVPTGVVRAVRIRLTSRTTLTRRGGARSE
jgi:hypothetical protein